MIAKWCLHCPCVAIATVCIVCTIFLPDRNWSVGSWKPGYGCWKEYHLTSSLSALDIPLPFPLPSPPLQVQAHGAPALPPREECIDASAILKKAFGASFRLVDEVQMLVSKEDPFALSSLQGKSKPGTPCSISGWMRFRDGRSPNLEFFCDVAPPPTLNDTMTTWVPTLEYAVHRFNGAAAAVGDASDAGTAGSAAPSPSPSPSPWVRFAFHSPVVCKGLVSTDGEVWSDEANPRILARSRQLARHLLPRSK